MVWNKKEARNKEIKQLYWGGMTQEAIGKKFKLTQSRVCWIIHDRRAPYRCCRRCTAHIKKGSVCPTCINNNRNKRLAEHLKNRIQRDSVREVGKDAWAVVRNVRTKFRTQRRESIFLDRAVDKLLIT